MKKGITLVETVVAVTVLTLALGGPFLLAAQSLRTAAYAKEEVTAARLAEEGLEIVHSIRDNNAGEDQNKWKNFIESCSGSGCVVDISARDIDGGGAGGELPWTASTLVPCSAPGCSLSLENTRVYQHSSGLLYVQNKTPDATWIATGMKRRVYVVAVNPNNEYKVISEVSFTAGRQTRTVTLNDTIMHWFPTFNTLKGT